VAVLGSARTGLIFTRSREGSQPGGLTQTGQTDWAFDTVGLSRSVLSRGSQSQLRSMRGTGGRELLQAFLLWFCIYFLLVLLLLPFASFAVLLKCPYPHPRVLPFSFHSPPHAGGGRGDRAAAWPLVAGHGPNRNSSFMKCRVKKMCVSTRVCALWIVSAVLRELSELQ